MSPQWIDSEHLRERVAKLEAENEKLLAIARAAVTVTYEWGGHATVVEGRLLKALADWEGCKK